MITFDMVKESAIHKEVLAGILPAGCCRDSALQVMVGPARRARPF